MSKLNLITRRGFLDRSMKISMGVALATLTDIPLVVKRALAEGNIGLNGKKLLFIFLRGGLDGLNSVIPVEDSAYATSRPTSGIGIPKDAIDYTQAGPCDYPQSSSNSAAAEFATFFYNSAIRLGNGFAALHPSLKFLAPVYNAGDLAVLHRVGYPRQSRSHFDSQIYWENGNPGNNLSKDGIFYRTIIESGLANSSALTGVSIQSGLPLLLRGSAAAMTNLSDPTRYNLLGVPNDANGNNKADSFLNSGNFYPFPGKNYRDLLALQYRNLSDTLKIFEAINFTEAGNTFVDNLNTDGDNGPYYLFPTSNAKNGGYAMHGNDARKYVVDTGAYGFFNNLKAAALILNKTDAIIAGTEFGGFDTHDTQGGVTGTLANLQRRIAWALYALRKYFMIYGKDGSAGDSSAKVSWDDLVVVTLSEFGRTTRQNSNGGTDHAEAGVMFVAGGGVNGGIHGCHPNQFAGNSPLNWVTGPTGSMFGVGNVTAGYLRRAYDYRSILGRLIRNHLGATQNQLNRIIPGYLNPGEALLSGGLCTIDNTQIGGEIPFV